jgi:hypothetical protein
MNFGCFFLLPLWRRWREAPDEGSIRAYEAEFVETNPSPGLHLAMQFDFSHKGKGAPGLLHQFNLKL